VNHWFLVARDVMWFFVGSSTLSAGILAGLLLSESDTVEGAGPVCAIVVIGGLLLQWGLIGAIYTGAIR
jgi:hypothetical protein